MTPGLTLRELMWMVDGRIDVCDRLHWNHTSGIMGILHNAHYKKRVDLSHYNPYVKSSSGGVAVKADNISVLKQLAGNRKGGG